MAHLTDEQIVSYRGRSLDAAELLRLSDHLAECSDCRARFLERCTIPMGLRLHLTYDQIAAFVDGHLPGTEAESVNAHAGECAECSAHIRDLRKLKGGIEASARQPGRTFPFWRFASLFAAAAACLLILFLVTRRREPERQVASVETQAPSTVIRDGARTIAISPDGKLAGLDGLPDTMRAAVEQALATQQIAAPAALSEIATNRDVLMGAPVPGEKVDLLQPVGVMVEAQRPVFRWKPIPGAEFQVSIYDGQFQPAATSAWIRAAEWTPASDLRRGIRYSWQLTVRRNGSEFTVPEPPAPEARFRVLDTAAESDLAGLRENWRDSHLVMGVAYARAGLMDEARRELQAAADQNSEVANLTGLLNSLKRGPVNSGAPQSR
jgi:anti-sigma factor RsiW